MTNLRSVFTDKWMRIAIPAVILVGGSLGALSAGAATSLPSGSIHGCVYFSQGRVLKDVYTNPSNHITCPKGTMLVWWNQTGPQGLKGDTGPQGPAGPSDLSVTATTAVNNRDDSGNHGNWATDAFTRVVTVTRHEAAAVSNCGGGATICYYYTASLADNGSFVTQTGAHSPNAGALISGTVQGTMTGGSKIEFYAGSTDGSWDGSPSAVGVPATVSGDTPHTSDWVKAFFSGSTTFSSSQLLNWSWTYNAPNTCEQWVDAYNNTDGTGTGAGDITGTNAC